MDGTTSLSIFPRTVRPDSDHRERLALALRRAAGSAGILSSTAKWLARLTGRTPKATQRWLDAENQMTVDSLIVLCRQFDEVWNEFRSLCGRDAIDAETILEEFAERLKSRRNGSGCLPPAP